MFPDQNRPPAPMYPPPQRQMTQMPPQGPFRGPQPQPPNQFQQRPMPPQNMPYGPQPGFQGPYPPQAGNGFGPGQPPRKKEGILSKVLGKSKRNGPQQPNPFAPAGQAATKGAPQKSNSRGGILDTLKNPNSLNDMLNNTQKVLTAAEQFTPMVQQYGPVIKNLPSVWNAFRTISSGNGTENKPDAPAPAPQPQTAEASPAPTVNPEAAVTVNNPKPVLKRARPLKKKKANSGPKLYI